jgi:hypothetical protein
MAKQTEEKAVGRRQPKQPITPPHSAEENSAQPTARARWDLFNLGVATYTLPLNVERLFADAARIGCDPARSELAPNVFLEAASLRESAHRLAPNAPARAGYDDALDVVLAGPPRPVDQKVWQRARENLVVATATVVGFCNPRLRWFAFGTAIGQWRQRMVDHLNQLVEDNSRRLEQSLDATHSDLMRGYTPPSFAPIFEAAAAIPADDANGVSPVRRLASVQEEDQDELEYRRVVREYAPGAAFDLAPWQLDLQSVSELEVALYQSLECAVGGRRPVPHWNSVTCDLRYQGRLIRHYAARAHSAIAVLNLFQSEEWTEVIRLPESLVPHVHDLVKSLNTNLPEIRFCADGTGRGIAWAPVT